jgi:hypothetical protein
MDEMSTQLLSLVVLMQFIGNFKELAMPIIMSKIKLFMAKRKRGKLAGQDAATEHDPKRMTKFEVESKMSPFSGTFDEYNEMAIQFGYVTLFAAAFPIASLASLVNNIIEIRSDAFKLVQHTQRPHYQGCEDIGSWQGVFSVLATLAVLTNVCLVGFTSLILSGKCVFTQDYPVGCDGLECDYFESDSFKAIRDGHTFKLQSAGDVTVDCSHHDHTDVCCPTIFNLEGESIVDEVSTTLFLQPYYVLLVVVLVEHALLFVRSLLSELIPDVPAWVVKAQARIDFHKSHLEKSKDVESPKGEEKWSDSEDKKPTVVYTPQEKDFVEDSD